MACTENEIDYIIDFIIETSVSYSSGTMLTMSNISKLLRRWIFLSALNDTKNSMYLSAIL